MLWWVIISQTCDDVRPVFLTTSENKARKELERLEEENKDNEVYFYLHSVTVGLNLN